MLTCHREALSSAQSCALSTDCVTFCVGVRSLGTVPPAEADVKMKGDGVCQVL